MLFAPGQTIRLSGQHIRGRTAPAITIRPAHPNPTDGPRLGYRSSSNKARIYNKWVIELHPSLDLKTCLTPYGLRFGEN